VTSLTDRQRLRHPHADQGSGLTKDANLERQGLHNRAKVLERVAGVPFTTPAHWTSGGCSTTPRFGSVAGVGMYLHHQGTG